MKIKDIEKIIEDYNSAAFQNQYHYNQAWSMRRLFAPNTENLESVTDYNLANNVGETSLDTLTEFIISNLFVQKEDWIKIDMTNEQDKVKATEEKLADMLDKSNFLEEISKTVREGNIWKMGYINVKYQSGLYFQQYMADTLVIPKAAGSLKRGYVLTDTPTLELYYQYENFSDLDPEQINPNETKKVLQCVIPIAEGWVENPDKNYRYARFDILVQEREILEPRVKDQNKYTLFPFIEYTPYTTRSLARKAHIAASHADYYEKLDSNSAEWRHLPPYEIDIENLDDDTANLYPGGRIPTTQNRARTQPIQATTAGDQYTMQKIAIAEQKVRNIFKVPQIEALTNLSLSQYEYHDKRAKVLELLIPIIGNLPAIISDILLKAHVLLFENDEEYKKIVGSKRIKFKQVGVNALIKKYKEMAGVGRTAQALAAYAQMGVPVAQGFNAERLNRLVTEGVGISEVLNTQDEQQQVDQAAADKERQMQELENQEKQSQILANQTKAEGV